MRTSKSNKDIIFLSLSTSVKNVTLGFTCLKSLHFMTPFHIVDQATKTTHEKFGCRVLVSCDQFFAISRCQQR